MNHDEEIWLPVPIRGYEAAYSISDRGRVRSEYRLITHQGPWRVFTRPIRERVLKPKPDGFVTLSVGNVPISIRVQDLVRQVFGKAAA
ncbi:MAG: NUMOD4 domain-containing protein [Mycobacterium sp.]